MPQFLFGVQRGAGQDLTITVGTATGGVQDPCNQTVQVTASGTPYPDSKVTVPSFPLHIIDKNQMPTVVVDATVHDFSFNNILPGTAGTKSGDIAATIDAAEVYPLFRLVPNPSKDSVCKALASANAPCVACAHNGQPYCLTIKAVQLGGTQATDAVKTIAAADIPSSCAKP